MHQAVSSLLLPPPAPGNFPSTFLLYGFAYSGYFKYMEDTAFCIWFLSLSVYTRFLYWPL